MARTDAMLACCQRAQVINIAMQAGTKQMGLSEVVLALRIQRTSARGDLLAPQDEIYAVFSEWNLHCDTVADQNEACPVLPEELFKVAPRGLGGSTRRARAQILSLPRKRIKWRGVRSTAFG